MNWYYVEAGQQAGPVDDAQLAELVRSGRIQPDTLVWREGMTDWLPYQTVQAPAASAGAPPLTMTASVATANEAVCAECGGIFNIQDMIPYSGVYVCARCKPIFMQKLAEGAKINTGVMRYAGFWVRGGAKFVDGIIVRLAAFPIGFVMGLAAQARTPGHVLAVQLMAGAVGLIITMAYTVFFLGRFGATPGKMACKIKVVCADGTPISYGKAFGRFWAELLSGCPTLMIGYIMAGPDEQKRALHDRICNTRVIFK
jgi:uncharacterized RDD family membrane protein YckC